MDPTKYCGCGRHIRYMKNIDGEFIGSCNKYSRCPSYDDLRATLETANKRLILFQKAINKIDDYFEYSNESKADQKKVYQILGNLTDGLKGE